MKKRALAAVAILAFMGVLPAGAAGQPSGSPAPGQAPVPPGEIAQMFDAYALMRAQEEIGIRDDQYAPFVGRFKALQETRRRGQQDRARLLQELRRLAQTGLADEAHLKERLKALQDLDSRAVADVRQAVDAIDQMLDVRQQARFRLFEEQIERRKLELLMRVRQANRPAPPTRRP